MTQNRNDINMGSLRSRTCRLLPGATPLAEVIEALRSRLDPCFVVVDKGAPVGVVDANALVDAASNDTPRLELDLDTPLSAVGTKRFLFTDSNTMLSDFLNENKDLDTHYIVITDSGGSCSVLTGQCHLDLRSYNSITMRDVMPLDHYVLATVERQTTCFGALELLSHEDVENLLVTGDGLPLGVITRADLARVIAQRHNPWKMSVLDAADRNIEIVDPDTPARKAAALLAEREPPYLLCRLAESGYAMVTRKQLDRHLGPHLRRLTSQFCENGLDGQQYFLGDVFLSQAMTDTLRMGVIALSSDLRVHYCNKAGLEILKTNMESLLDQDAASLAPKFLVFSQALDTAPLLVHDGPSSITLPPSTELGAHLQTKMTAIWEDGALSGYIVTIQDVSDVDLAEVKLRKLAYYDALTGLPNRALLLERLSSEIKRCKRSGERFSLLFVDLDGFKKINDNLGHSAGDELLRQVSASFLNILRESDTVARLGGDEFVFILPGAQTEKQTEIVVTKIRGSLDRPFTLGGTRVEVSCSIGRAIFPNNGVTPRSLIASADHGMYVEKKGNLLLAETPSKTGDEPSLS